MTGLSTAVQRLAAGLLTAVAGAWLAGVLGAAVAHAEDWAAAAEAPASCAKSDFEAVVDEAGAALRDLNATNKPLFQDKLRKLREKRGWTTDQFLKEAAPYVKDEKIDVWDETSSELLAKIANMGQEGSAAKSPDCTLLAELRGYLKTLVDTQTEKWTYMFGKIEAELAR
jgi:hypothetical protein